MVGHFKYHSNSDKMHFQPTQKQKGRVRKLESYLLDNSIILSHLGHGGKASRSLQPFFVLKLLFSDHILMSEPVQSYF